MNTHKEIERIFDKIDKRIFELEFTFYMNNDELSDKLNNFAVREAGLFIEHLKEPWEAFSRGVNERFNKLNGDDLSPEQRNLYLKEGLQFVAPKNIVCVLDEVFNISRLEEMKSRYDYVMDGFENNKFKVMVRRYRVSDGRFAMFYEALMAETKNLPEAVQVLSERYVYLLRELQRVEADDEAELYTFGAGILGSLLAGPLGGMATRSIIRSANNKQLAIHEAIDQIYDGLIELYNAVEQAFARIHKKVLYIYYTAYRGLMYRLEQDLKPYHYSIRDVNFSENRLELSLMPGEQEKLLNWYRGVEREVSEHIRNKNYADANIVSEHLLQFFMKNPDECELKYENHCLGYRALVLRYTVLATWLKQSLVTDKLEQAEAKLRKVHRFYTKLFDDMTFGINDIRAINDVDVPLMLETVFHYVHVTEVLAKVVADESFELRSHTIHSLLEYVQRFSEKRVGKDSLAFENEYVDRRTLAVINSYQKFLMSINVRTITSSILKNKVHQINSNKIANEYDFFVDFSNLEQSLYYKYLLEDEQLMDKTDEPNEHLYIKRVEQSPNAFDESDLQEELPLLQLYGFLEFRERTLRGDMEDNEAGRSKWMWIWNDRIQFLEHYLIAKIGDAEAQFTVAEWYAAGKGVEASDEDSFYWMLEAAQQDYLQAVALMPQLYRDGKGVEANPKKSFKWMERLTSLTNSPEDQFILGRMYLEGYGTRVHYKKGYNLYRKAAKQGYARAYYKLGQLDEKDGNVAKAKEWYEAAIKLGHAEARARMQQIEDAEFRKKLMRFVKVVVPLAIVSAIAVYLFVGIYLPKARYAKANELMLAGKYSEAVPILEKITNYKDGIALLEEAENNILYNEAEMALAGGSYDEAIETFELLEGFRNSWELSYEARYLQAKEWFDQEQFTKAVHAFAEITDYEDAEEYLQTAQENLYVDAIDKKSAGDHNAARKLLFHIVNYKDAWDQLHQLNSRIKNDISVDISQIEHLIVVDPDKSEETYVDDYIVVHQLENIVQVVEGERHTSLLLANGRVKSVVAGTVGRRYVDDWTNIVEIAAGRYFVAGLTHDGDVLHDGFDPDSIDDLAEWEDIVTFASYPSLLIGLKADGTVLVTGYGNQYYEPIDLSGWRDIIDISVHDGYIIGLQADGTVMRFEI